MILLLGLGGCTAKPIGGPLPTLAPEAREKENVRDEVTGDAEGEEKEDKSGAFDIMSYVEQSRQAKNELWADTIEMAILTACLAYVNEGAKLPEEPIRFRYTHELDGMDDAYASLKEVIRDIVGDNEITLSEGCYLMVEISKEENGTPKVEVKVMQE